MNTQTKSDAFSKAQHGAIQRVPLTKAEMGTIERTRPDLIVVEDDAVLIAEPRTDRIDLHYAYPSKALFERQFAPMLEQVVANISLQDAPFGVNLRLADRSLRPYVEPVLIAQAFQMSREWIRMELDDLSNGAPPPIPMDFALRPAMPSDVGAIVQLIYDSFEDPTVNPRGWTEAVIDNQRLVRVLADTVGTLAGLLHLRPEDTITGYVSELAIHPDLQRRGLGEALMRWALASFRGQGLRRAALTTDPDNERAIALYRKLGFTVTEEGVDYRLSLDEDEVQRVLEKHKAGTRKG